MSHPPYRIGRIRQRHTLNKVDQKETFSLIAIPNLILYMFEAIQLTIIKLRSTTYKSTALEI